MDLNQKIEQYLKVFCEEIGARPTGSRPNAAAVDFACREFEKYGYEVIRQPFNCMDWSEGACSLTVCGCDIPVRPAPYACACDVKGALMCIPSLSALREARITGKIVVLTEELASEPLMPKNFIFWNPASHQETISLLEKGRPLAVLTVSLSRETYVPVIEDGDFDLPCAVLLPESLAALHNGAQAALKINADRRPVTAANVIASNGRGDTKVCLSAHIDTKAGTPGALDNASGAAVLLALASELSNRALPYRVEFVLFNGEDYYCVPGEMTYVASSLSRPAEYICAYNIDGAGLAGQNLCYSFYGCDEKFVRRFREQAEACGKMTEADPWPQGDHTLFTYAGVPAVAVTSCGIFELSETVLHTAADTLNLVDVQKLAALVRFLCGVLN